MSAFLTITESMIMTAMGDFLTACLPAAVQVVQGQDHRVPEPKVADFVVMWPLGRSRLETNTDTYSDITFQGSIAAEVLTVAGIEVNPTPGGKVIQGLQAGQTIYGVGIAAGTAITAQTSGTPGGNGQYTVSISQTVATELMGAGLVNSLSPMLVTIQLDVHGPNSADNAQILETLFRDDVACEFFEAIDALEIAPLFIDEGSQIPFVNAAQQYENRWVLKARLQANPTVATAMQFADTLEAGLIEVEAHFPA